MQCLTRLTDFKGPYLERLIANPRISFTADGKYLPQNSAWALDILTIDLCSASLGTALSHIFTKGSMFYLFKAVKDGWTDGNTVYMDTIY